MNLAMKMNMKKLALLLCLAGCGSNNDHPTPTPTPEMAVIVTPTPIPQIQEPVVGNWIDSKQNILQINEDHTAKSNQELLTWKIDQNQIIWSSASIEIDACVYQIKTAGGFSTDLIITLKLFCDKSGALSYIKTHD